MARKTLILIASLAWLCGCTQEQLLDGPHVKEAAIGVPTRAGSILLTLPEPESKIATAVYEFQDQTGQFKSNDRFADFSSAVTKGGHAILTKALLDAGSKKWFTVTERGNLKNLLQERQLIKMTRLEYAGASDKLPSLPPLIYSGMLIEGGIVSYDSNIVTGGAGAIYLGIGGNVQYRRDLVTVYLRAVSVQTGEVLLSVTSSKTVFSSAVGSNVLKYITFDRLLQAEAGFTVNEPAQLCVRQAVETAVYSLVMEGAIDRLWNFKDYNAGQRAIAEYTARRDGTLPPDALASTQPKEPETAQAAPVEPVAQQPVVQTQAAPAAPQAQNIAPTPAPMPQAKAMPLPAPAAQPAAVAQAAPLPEQQQPQTAAASSRSSMAANLIASASRNYYASLNPH